MGIKVQMGAFTKSQTERHDHGDFSYVENNDEDVSIVIGQGENPVLYLDDGDWIPKTARFADCPVAFTLSPVDAQRLCDDLVKIFYEKIER